MSQLLDLGNVMGPAGPNKITSSTTTDMTGILYGVNGYVTAVEMAKPEDVQHLGAVPITRKINNKTLDKDITLTASDINAVAKTGDTMTGTLAAPDISVDCVRRENIPSTAGGDANTCLTVVNNPSNAYGVTEHHDVFLGASGLAYAVPLICGLRLRTEASSLTDYGNFYVTPEAVQAVTPGENPEELTTFAGNMYLGSSGHKWKAGYIDNIYSSNIIPYTINQGQSLSLQGYAKSNPTSTYASGNVTLVAKCSCSDTGVFGTTVVQSANLQWGYEAASHRWCLTPSGGTNGSTSGCYCGSPTYKWDAVYAVSGTIQTSDRASKDNIKYLINKSSTMIKGRSVDETTTRPQASITIDDVVDFVNNLDPVTFCYKYGQETTTEETSTPESIQLGLIANEIENHPLFKYVGVKSEYEEVVTPEELDEQGNVVTEAITETKTSLGLQPIPLAVTALTACKYLLNQLDIVNERLAQLESK